MQAGLPLPTYTDPTLAPGTTTAKTVHVTEIRNALNGVPTAPATYGSAAPDSTMHAGAMTLTGTTANAGGIQPHENRQSYLATNYCISLFGVFPPMA